MDEKLLELLSQIRPDIDFTKETHLLSDEIFDSFDIIMILAQLTETYGIEIEPEDVTEANFDSAQAISRFVESKQKN